MLPYEQLKGILTQTFIRIYNEKIPAPSFLRTFFPVKTYDTATISLAVSRGTEKISTDVIRGTRGNFNKFSLLSEKAYLPGFHNEYFDATQLDHYDIVNSTASQIASLAKTIAEKYIELRNKIERAKELQCSQVFETGTVELINGDNIDYKRKATSMVDLAASGGYWTTPSTDIESQLIAAAQFIRNNGKNGTPEFNAVMSGSSYVHLKNSDFFKTNANYNQVKLIDIVMPQTSAFGASYHGTISAGAYKFHIWTYDEVYETNAGVITRYWPEEKVAIVPVKGTDFELSHGAVPAIMRANGVETIGRMAAEYYQWDNVDKNEMAHYYHIASAPVAVPITLDMIYTMDVQSAGGGAG